MISDADVSVAVPVVRIVAVPRFVTPVREPIPIVAIPLPTALITGTVVVERM